MPIKTLIPKDQVMKLLLPIIALLILPASLFAKDKLPSSQRSEKAYKKVVPKLQKELNAKNLLLGNQIFIRIFKAEAELEVWIENNNKTFSLFKTYPICTFSGDLGPKQKQGDKQSPEGFYFVKANQMNPWSRFHLSFNLGYPNRYERAKGYTGSALMVHGNCVSIGCYAMTDDYIEEIYSLAFANLQEGIKQGKSPFFRVHAFPFHMNDSNMVKYKDYSQWQSFWANLKQGYDWFEQKKTPPNVTVKNGQYYFE